MNVLVIEDDPEIGKLLVEGLSRENFKVVHASCGEDGLKIANSNSFDAIIVDLMLPGIDGLAVISALRDKHNITPVLILSAKREVDDRVRGLKGGGDDYLTKPFSFGELVARLEALVRRSTGNSEQLKIDFCGVCLDRFARRVTRDGKSVELHPREMVLLELLMSSPGRPVTKRTILEKVWNYRFEPQTNVVDVLVCRLRSKIDEGFTPKLIHTVRGVGYFIGLEPEPTAKPEQA